MKLTLLAVALVSLIAGSAQAQWGHGPRPGWNPQPQRNFDRGRNDQPRFQISVGFGQASCIGQTGLVNGVLCQLVQGPYGLQWIPLQQPCNPGYNPGYSPNFNPGYQAYGGSNSYQQGYQQTLDQLQQEAIQRQKNADRQAGQRTAEQQFNGGYYPQPQQFAAPQYYAPTPNYGNGYPGWNCPSAR